MSSSFIRSLLLGGELRINEPTLHAAYFDRWFCDKVNSCNGPAKQVFPQRGLPVILNNCPLDAVIWREGAIAEYETQRKTDLVSFNFSGCLMAGYEYKGGRRAAHIHAGGGEYHDCKKAWCEYVPSLDRSRMGRFVLFRPDGDRRERLIAKLRSDRVQFDDVSVMGVITATFECYSVGLVLQTCDNMQLWQVAFIEQHLAPTTFESYAEILRIEPSLWEQFYWNRMPVRELRLDRWRPWKMNLFGL